MDYNKLKNDLQLLLDIAYENMVENNRTGAYKQEIEDITAIANIKRIKKYIDSIE